MAAGTLFGATTRPRGVAMATRTFTLNTKPHEANIGDKTLLFEPEVTGAEFVERYTVLREVQQKLAGVGGTKGSRTDGGISAEDMLAANAAMREFITRFLLPESRDDFAALRLPDRVLVQLIEFLGEVYGAGSGNQGADGGMSSD